MPWTWQIGFDDRSLVFGEIQERAQEVYDRILPRPFRPQRFSGLLGGTRPDKRPDILIVAVESLRHDVLDPETMPHVWEMSEQGVRLNEHYATSNASHYGLFALLYGRSPLFYFETLDSKEPPTLPFQLKEWGYTTHYLSCSDTHWREMDRFIGPPHFSVERSRGRTLEDCDGKMMSRAAELLESDSRAPRFVLAFMMSTHFGYHYPEGAGAFAPALPPPNALALNAERDRGALLNRYRNSAHYVDALIGSLLERLDRDNTLIVVTGDHGESLFDDGTIAHSSLLSEIQTRVPFAMSGPGVDRASARSGPTDHRDVLPTVFGRLGLSFDSLQAFPGRDLLSPGERAFAPLVHAKARRGGTQEIALVSSSQRYSIRLDVDTGRLRFLGKLGENGRPLREPVSIEEGDMSIGWLEQYLNSLVD
jgi:membrane-anchored protein YejM (alkaline phosphatase superfamily)